ncbi:hypothetical protein GCM10025857_38190 [Alicyclobacillus contaminans]|uniref:helix-turn-helix domain-containing protein n=1 Tax=Alicyclobacillus contaminans TaxID=392016 RepID=UPI0003F8A82E|nr:helix-turn-helix domain-containing protein [Alicyclobacillus contaminans]GMA52462.1 hypothetical protein GCM10025857_38190 [Alicyclobacillus contaminans]
MQLTLGQKIRKLRKERRLTQTELAAGIVTPSMISQIEADKATPSPPLLAKLADRLGVLPSFFADDLSAKSGLTHAYRRAKHLMDSEHYDLAIPILRSLLQPLAPQFREEMLLQDLAICYEHTTRYDDAITVYERLVQLALERDDAASAVQCYFRIGAMERRRNRIGLARLHWTKAAELLRRHPELEMPLATKIHANLARIYVQMQQHTLAIAGFWRAAVWARRFQVHLDLAMALQGMGTSYIEIGQYEEGEQKLREAMDVYRVIHHQRGVNQCLIHLAVGYRLSGQVQEAVEHLTQCIKSREFRTDGLRLAHALAERAVCHLAAGQPEAAIQDAEDALTLVKDTPEVQGSCHLTLAEAYLASQRPAAALEAATAGLQYESRIPVPSTISGLYAVRARAHRLLDMTPQAAADAEAVARLARAAYSVQFPVQ